MLITLHSTFTRSIFYVWLAADVACSVLHECRAVCKCLPSVVPVTVSPVPVLADDLDTDLETDRLLGQQRTDDHGFYDEKVDIF